MLHLALNSFFFEHESVLVPDEIGGLRVVALPLHASFEQANDVAVVGILSEGEAAAVMHEFFEFLRLVFAKVFDFCLYLLLFDVSIFFSF